MDILVDRLTKRTLANGIALDLVICARFEANGPLRSIEDALKPFKLEDVREISILVRKLPYNTVSVQRTVSLSFQWVQEPFNDHMHDMTL